MEEGGERRESTAEQTQERRQEKERILAETEWQGKEGERPEQRGWRGEEEGGKRDSSEGAEKPQAEGCVCPDVHSSGTPLSPL